MRRLVPATEFITWARPERYKSNASYEVKVIEKELRSKQMWMTYRFKYPPVVMLKKLMVSGKTIRQAEIGRDRQRQADTDR